MLAYMPYMDPMGMPYYTGFNVAGCFSLQLPESEKPMFRRLAADVVLVV